MRIEIETPIWATRSVGIAKDKITEEIEVEILYKDRHGKRCYPHTYIMSKARALGFPSQTIRGRELKIIPIAEFKVQEKRPQSLAEGLDELPKKPVFGDSKTIYELRWKK